LPPTTTTMMQQRILSLAVFAIVASSFQFQSADAFASPTSRSATAAALFGLVEQPSRWTSTSTTPRATRLYESTEEGGVAEGGGEAEEVVAADATEDTEEVQVEVEDPEVTAIKAEIDSLEADLRKKRKTLDATSEQAETFSKGGYARKVADMENMRKMRRSLQSSNKDSSTANVVQKFLPVLDELAIIADKNGDNEFSKKYSSLGLDSTFQELGVAAFTADVGGEVDMQRLTVVEEEYSNDFSKGTVIRPIAMGMELNGNVMRFAKVVGSLGSEADAKEAEEKAAAAATATATAEETPTEDAN